MNFIKLPMIAVIGLACAMGFSACSDDDDDNNNGVIGPGGEAPSGVAPIPSQVFPNGMPASVGDMAITKDAQGRVTKIFGTTESYTFEYPAASRAEAQYDVIMTCVESYGGYTETTTFNILLNDKGYARYALEVYDPKEGDAPDEWWFEYNADGQLSQMKRSEGDETTVLTYTNGDITSVTTTDREGDVDRSTISYGNSPMANKGCIMLFDATFDTDMDEFAIAYYAGMLGKATKNLPVKCQDADSPNEYEEFVWKLNGNGFPTELTVIEHYGQSSYEEYSADIIW